MKVKKSKKDKKVYTKPELKKQGSLKDITAGRTAKM